MLILLRTVIHDKSFQDFLIEKLFKAQLLEMNKAIFIYALNQGFDGCLNNNLWKVAGYGKVFIKMLS